jgi:hypothetical protein
MGLALITTKYSTKDNISIDVSLRQDAYRLARSILKNEKQADKFAKCLLEICLQARDKDFLVVHNPGGWGHARMDECLDWERGIVTGVAEVLQKMGYSCLVTQYFRSGKGWRQEIADFKEQFRYFSYKADIMADWLRFILDHLAGIKVILIGVSQGAAFGNAVRQRLDDDSPVYSIELGFPFHYRSRRVKSAKTLAIDSNGSHADKFVQGTFLDASLIVGAAPFKWLIYRIRGKPMLLSHCVKAPGHEYDWNTPEIARQIMDFIDANFRRSG